MGSRQIEREEEDDPDFDPVDDDDGDRSWNDEVREIRSPSCLRLTNPTVWPYPWLPDWLCENLNLLFACVSDAFDRKFYVSGVCETRKNSLYGYTAEERKQGVVPREARHNILYNYLFQQLCLLAGGYEAYRDYRFVEFFPLHRSKSVMDKLNSMMRQVADDLHWPLYWEIAWEEQEE